MPSAVSSEKRDASDVAADQESEKQTKEEAPSESIERKPDIMTDGRVFVLERIVMTLNIVGLGMTEPPKIVVGPHETVHEIRQVVYDRPDTCYRTCFSIQLDGQRLDEFAEFSSVQGLKDGSTLKLVEEPYTLRDGKLHVRRVRELLSSSMIGSLGSAYGAGQSPSLLNAIMQADPEQRIASCSVSKTEKESGIDFMPPDYVLPPDDDDIDEKAASGLREPPLTPLLPHLQDLKSVECIYDITYSSWNPPPGSRRMKGDLFYLDVVTLDRAKYCITATPAGFFVNRSDEDQFNPSPARDPCKDYTLVGLLSQLIPSFRKSFTLLTKSCIKENVIEQCPSPFTVNVWVAHKQQHMRDSLRANDSATLWSLVQSEEICGQTREWNEELMQAREMPKVTLQQRIIRMRTMFKWAVEFAATVAKGCCLAVDGSISALNPNDEDNMMMYLWNNVFFSYPNNCSNLYDNIGGDLAAHAVASYDIKGIEAINKIDVDGIYTVGTAIVDYRGRRLVAQNVVPGLLRRSSSQDSLIKHGVADQGKNVCYSEEFSKLLEEPAEKLKLRKHKVFNEKDEVVEMHFPIDCKGVRGTDGRCYLIDLWRLFPPDANFLHVPRIPKNSTENLADDEEIAEDKEAHPFDFPQPRHRIHALRPEAISSFVRLKYFKYLQIAALRMNDSQKHRENVQLVAAKDEVVGEPSESESLIKTEEQRECTTESLVPETETPIVTDNGLDQTCEQALTEEELSSSAVVAEIIDFIVDGEVATTNVDSVKETCNTEIVLDSSGSSVISPLPEIKSSEEKEKRVILLGEKELAIADQKEVNGEVASSSSELETLRRAAASKFPFVAANDHGTLHSNDPQTEEVLLTAVKLAGSSVDKEFNILFNPDVYGSAQAADSEETIRSDQLLIQDVSDHLLRRIIPNFLDNMTSTALIPTDGIALATLMHSRGIGMRYLGKIGSLVATNRKLDHVFRICVLEMIARSVKHVFRIHLHEVSLQNTSSIVAHLLNCLLSSCDNCQSPLVADEQMYGSSRLKKKRSKKRGGSGKQQQQQHQQHSDKGGSGPAVACVSPSSLWKEVVDDTKISYGFHFDQCGSCPVALEKYHLSRLSLLRLVCKKLGFQLVLREYDFRNRKQPTFTEDDVLDVVPIVKYASPTAGDTPSLCDGAQSRMHAGQFAEALGILFEAMNIYQQVYGAIHEELGTVFRLLARLHYLMEDLPQAISYQRKAAVICERVHGIDHPDTIVAYVHLGLYCHAAGQISVALRLMYRARYLTLLAYGEGHPDFATFDTNIGLMLHGLKEYKLSLRFLKNALKLHSKYQGDDSIHCAMGHHLVARALANTGAVQQAIKEERNAYAMYTKLVGPDDIRSKGSRDCVKQLTRIAVDMQRKMNETRSRQEQESTLDLEFLSQVLHQPQTGVVVTSRTSSGSTLVMPPSTATVVELADGD